MLDRQEFHCSIHCECGNYLGRMNLEKPINIVEEDVKVEISIGGDNLICPKCKVKTKVAGITKTKYCD